MAWRTWGQGRREHRIVERESENRLGDDKEEKIMGQRRIIIVGGGFGGVQCAKVLSRSLRPANAEVVLFNDENHLVFSPLLAEVVGSSVNALDVIVIDSVAALVPKAELEGEMGMATMGMQARLMSQALRKLTAVLAKAKTTCVFTNQMREKVGISVSFLHG